MLTFEQFQATRREVSNLADVIDDASLEGVSGYVYCNALCIEKGKISYLLTLDRLTVLGRDLTQLERRLYKFACAKGYCGE